MFIIIVGKKKNSNKKKEVNGGNQTRDSNVTIQKLHRRANEVLINYGSVVLFNSQATVEGTFLKKLVSSTKKTF